MFSNVRTLCATYVKYICLKLWGTSFPVSVSVQLRPIVSGIGRQYDIGLTLILSFIFVKASVDFFLQSLRNGSSFCVLANFCRAVCTVVPVYIII